MDRLGKANQMICMHPNHLPFSGMTTLIPSPLSSTLFGQFYVILWFITFPSIIESKSWIDFTFPLRFLITQALGGDNKNLTKLDFLDKDLFLFLGEGGVHGD